MLAMADCQAHQCRMGRRYREHARSYRVPCQANSSRSIATNASRAGCTPAFSCQ